MARRLLFIINPKAGKKLGPAFLPMIAAKLEGKLDHAVHIWENLDEFEKIIKELAAGGFTDAIAVGGDGTVNMVGKSILGSELKLGILPAGSGNGLARSLGISMNHEKALEQIISGNTAIIDSGEVNGIPFFCTSGVGFDAHIGHLFAGSIKRGFQSYLKIVWKEFSGYQPQHYRIKMNGQELEREAFLITVCNAAQYGNDFFIGPGARLDDGKFLVTLLHPFRLSQAPGLLVKTLQKKIDKSPLVETYACSELVIERKSDDFIHFDGEPFRSGTSVHFKIKPHSLRVIVGDAFKAG